MTSLGTPQTPAGLRPAPSYYYVPRWLVYALALMLVGGALALWVGAPRWLPRVAYALDVDVPIEAPDAVVLDSNGLSDEAERLAARMVTQGQARAIVLLGIPFTPDELVPVTESRRVRRLVALGVPRAALVEVYQGGTAIEETWALDVRARERGLRRLLLVGTSPGTRRDYLLARRILGPDGIEVGAVTLPGASFDPEHWWRDERGRSAVAQEWIRLVLAVVFGRR